MNLKISHLLSATLFSLFLFSSANAEEVAGKQWPANKQTSIDKIDHKPFDTLLQKYVDKDGLVNYKAWHASQEDRATLTTYLETLSCVDPNAKAERNAKLAFWINAYNAVTIEGILRVYPTTSIRNHTAKVVGYNIWKDLYLYVGNTKINLNDIEHEVLRKMSEPRIHFAIACASIGCPRLYNNAYVADKLETQLTTNTTDFFSRSQNLQVDAQRSKLNLSEIMNWFGTDFGATQAQQIQAIAPYFPENAKTFVGSRRYSIGFLSYDWNLNTQK